MNVKKVAITALITSGIGAIVTEMLTKFKPITFIINFLLEPVVLKVWGVILLMLVLPCLCLLFIVISNFLEPPYYKYTSDTLKGLKWQWEWSNYKIYNLVSLCPNCQYQPTIIQTRPYGQEEYFECKCEHCGFNRTFRLSYDYLKSQIEREIQLKIRNNEYLKIINKPTTQKDMSV